MKQFMIMIASCLSLFVAGTIQSDPVFAKTSSTMQEVTKDVENHILQLDETFTVHYTGNIGKFVKEITKVVPNAIDRKAEIKSIVQTYNVTYYTSQNGGQATFHLSYYTTKAKQEKALKKIKEVAKDIKTRHPNSKYYQVKAVHNYILQQTTYDRTEVDRYSIYGVVENGRAVCQGYAMTAYYLLKELQVDAKYVTGIAGNENHAWNKVKLGGNWYNMDVTWDDTGSKKLNYRHFLVSDKTLAVTHQWDTSSFPSSPKKYKSN